MKKVAFLFPGQGSQYVGMGKKLCEEHRLARETFAEANEALGFDLQKLCFEGGMEELTKTENAQPAILTASIAALRVLKETMNIKPQYCAGHSLGEYAALVCAEALVFTDALQIVRKRGRYMQEAVAEGIGTMAAISGVSQEVIEDACRKVSTEDHFAAISNDNGPDQIVISGHVQAVHAVGDRIKEIGGRWVPLKVSGPFHSPLMQPAADRLYEELLKYTYHDLQCPVIANATALPYTGKESILQNLTAQILEPVKWQGSMAFLKQQNMEAVIDLGPRSILKNLMRQNIPSIQALSMDQEEDMKLIAEIVVSRPNIQAFLAGCTAIAVSTKNRNDDKEAYEQGVSRPYKKIKQLLETLEREGQEATAEHMQEAFAMLNSVFAAKLTPAVERKERIRQLLKETRTEAFFPEAARR